MATSDTLLKLPPIVFVQRYNKKKADIIVIGNPKENKLSDGADLVTTPITTLSNVIPTTTGSIISAPNLNIRPPASIPNLIIWILKPFAPIGRIL